MKLPSAMVALVAAFSTQAAGAQESAVPSQLTFEGYSFTIEAGSDSVRTEEYLGRNSLIIRNGTVWIDGTDFANGVIEYDVAFDDRFGFSGAMWRASDAETFEYFYLRTGNGGWPDAIQYSPVMHGNDAWQIYSDSNAQAGIGFVHNGWNHVRIVVSGDRADIFVNGSTAPVLHVPDLKTDNVSGMVGFRSTWYEGEVRLSNIAIRPLFPDEAIAGTPAETELPDGIITQWSVSDAMSEASVADQLMLADGSGTNRTTLAVESNGVADLARAATLAGRDSNTVLVSTRITSSTDQLRLMRFGYSDRVRLYLNGRLLFTGNATWRSRDVRFLGTIGFNDAIALPLAAGENVLTAAVSESFGGWGWAATIENREGITITPGQ